ncbi:hypothetical protein FKW77_008754 [Venturia effusa]|uniref:Uncharacterized protein n=1 Tax=Venturia effusa TaxID=50376 RepID=A0A517L7W3_9PEZI|nr:hypothetical protein FKW77_008754 [Venturia effusa]
MKIRDCAAAVREFLRIIVGYLFSGSEESNGFRSSSRMFWKPNSALKKKPLLLRLQMKDVDVVAEYSAHEKRHETARYRVRYSSASKNRLTHCFCSTPPFPFPPTLGLQTPAKVAGLYTMAVSCLATADAHSGIEEPGAVNGERAARHEFDVVLQEHLEPP